MTVKIPTTFIDECCLRRFRGVGWITSKYAILREGLDFEISGKRLPDSGAAGLSMLPMWTSDLHQTVFWLPTDEQAKADGIKADREGFAYFTDDFAYFTDDQRRDIRVFDLAGFDAVIAVNRRWFDIIDSAVPEGTTLHGTSALQPLIWKRYRSIQAALMPIRMVGPMTQSVEKLLARSRADD
jgi:hypothetical protein